MGDFLTRGSVIRLTAASLLMLSTFGCSYLTPAKDDGGQFDSIPLSIDVFAARGFLGGSDYERYYLQEDFVWRECGNVAKRAKSKRKQKIEGDEVFADDPGLELKQRRVEAVSLENRRLLKRRVAQFIESLAPDRTKEPPPGSFFALSDPGLFELKVKLGSKSAALVTSVDAVAEGETLALERAHAVFSALRAIGPTICQAATFYGIGRNGS